MRQYAAEDLKLFLLNWREKLLPNKLFVDLEIAIGSFIYFLNYLGVRISFLLFFVNFLLASGGGDVDEELSKKKPLKELDPNEENLDVKAENESRAQASTYLKNLSH